MSSRRHQRGVTLVEILVVMAIVTLLVAGVLMGSGQLASAKLRRATTSIAAAVRVAFTRASVMSRAERIVFDFGEKTFWLEESDAPMLVQSKDVAGTGGAEAVTEAEKKKAAEESDRIVKGPTTPKPAFHKVDFGLVVADDESKDPAVRPLPSGIQYRSIQTTHDEEPRTEGRAYLYFWPGGLTERASIVFRKGTSTDDTDALTVWISPLTGTATVKSGAVALPKADERDVSEREDQGAF
jgi:general secretion pathway protein H